MKTTLTLICLTILTAGVAEAQTNSYMPAASSATLNVVIKDPEPIKDLPEVRIRWYPPVADFGGNDESYIDLIQGIPKKELAVGCSGGFGDLDNNSAPAANPPSKTKVTITRGTPNGDKKYGKKTAATVRLLGIWIGLIQKKIPADTLYFDFRIQHSGSGNTIPNLGIGYNCGVVSADGTELSPRGGKR